MEAFFKEISSRLERHSNELGQHIEPQHKKLLANSYECMAACYRSPGSIEEASDCSEKCHEPVQKTQNEIQGVVENIQNFFQNCMQSCKITHGKNESNLKSCISECTEQTADKFIQAKVTTLTIINRFVS